MRRIAYILLIVFALLEGSVVSFPLTLSIATSIAINWPTTSYPWIFVGGMILDMFTPRLWGVSSIFFLGIQLLLQRIQTKLLGKGIIFISVFILLVHLLYSVLYAGGIDHRFVIVGTILGVLFTILFARFATTEVDPSRLSV